MVRLSRMRLPFRIALALLASLLLFMPLQAPAHGDTAGLRQGLFLDNSGSMRPYFASGLMEGIVQPLEAAINNGGSAELFAFSTEVSPARSLDAIEHGTFGQYTFLDKVIEACERRHLAVAWIVTDNIEDTGEAGNTDRFYRTLRSPAVKRVTVFPVRAGAGKPGLVVYALLFDSAAGPAYATTLHRFASGGSGVVRTEPLLMKPVDRDTVEVTSRDMAPLTRRGGPRVYDTGQPIHSQVEVRFRSRFDHIEIVDSRLRIADARPAFSPDSLLAPSARQLTITPDRIRELGPGGETAEVYRLSVNLGELHLKSSPAAWWRAAWGKPEEEAELPLVFAIDVPQQNFRLRPQFLEQWSAPTVAQARATGKVYALDKLLSSVNAGDTEIRVSSPLFYRVRYPAWPAMLWVGLLLLAIAVVLALLFAVRQLLRARPKSWSVRAQGADGVPLAARIQDGRVLVEEQPVARIEGGDLLPIAPARFGNGSPRLAIPVGEPVRLTTRLRQMDLVFSPAGQEPPPPPSANPRTPPSRAARPSAASPAAPSPKPSSSPPSTPPRRR